MISKFLLGEEQTRGKLCKFAGEAADRVEAIFDIEKEKESETEVGDKQRGGREFTK